MIKYHHGGGWNGVGNSTGDCWWQNCHIANMSQKYTMGERVISQSDGWPQTTCRGSGEGTKWIMRDVLPLDLWQSDRQQCSNAHSFKHAFWCYLNWYSQFIICLHLNDNSVINVAKPWRWLLLSGLPKCWWTHYYTTTAVDGDLSDATQTQWLNFVLSLVSLLFFLSWSSNTWPDETHCYTYIHC